jgi:hypothetical protein
MCGHLQKECPEKGNMIISSTTTRCNCRLTEGENPHPDNYRDCRHAKDMQNEDYNGKGALFQPHHSKHVLRGEAPRQDRGTVAASDTSGGSARSRHNGTQAPCIPTPTQTACNRSVSSGRCLSLEKVLRVVTTVVQHIMTELDGAVLKEAKTVTITKIVLNLTRVR